MFHHAGSGADGGDAETVLDLQRFDFLGHVCIRTGKEQLNGIETVFSRFGEASGQVLMKDEGTGSRFRNSTQSDGSLHQTDSRMTLA